MRSSRRGRYVPAPHVDNMMERLGIDPGCCVTPRFGLRFLCALRTCSSCPAPDTCTAWLAEGPRPGIGPPKFCPNADLLWELLSEPAIGRRLHRP
jgi:Family of unknown function (DUF6455)